MACLNSLDIVPYPGARYSSVQSCPSVTFTLDWLASSFAASGWSVSVRGSGYEARSVAAPWCAPGVAPAEYVGRVKVLFYPSSAVLNAVTFECRNIDETMVQTSTGVHLRASVGTYAAYPLMFIGTQYDAKIDMLGVAHRTAGAINQTSTAVFLGVPQIPGFLQSRGGGFCEVGVEEMFYCIDASQIRLGPLWNEFDFWAAGIKTLAQGTFMNTNTGGRGSFKFAYGIEGGGFTSFGSNFQTGYWVYDVDSPSDPDGWNSMLWPAIIEWRYDAANPTTTRRKMGFMWDSVIANKAFPGDKRLRFDNHEFVVFNDQFEGAIAPVRPPGSLLLCVSGPV